MERPVRGGLRADAVCLFTLARSVIRSIWKTPDHSALKSRSRLGLHRDGDGAHVELALPRPNYFRNRWRKISENNSRCGVPTRSARSRSCVLITNFGG